MRSAALLLLLSLPLCGATAPIALTDAEVARGLKAALVQGADRAVLQLGREDGFLANEQVRIPLPPGLARADPLLRKLGMGRQSDQLLVAINRAAEQAIPQARALILDAVAKMTIQDAKAILTGSEDAATRYFRRNTETALTARFLPVVEQATARVQVAETYRQYARRAVRFRLVKREDADLDAYVTQKALDGLFLTIAQEERNIRRDPLQQSGPVLRQVFGVLK